MYNHLFTGSSWIALILIVLVSFMTCFSRKILRAFLFDYSLFLAIACFIYFLIISMSGNLPTTADSVLGLCLEITGLFLYVYFFAKLRRISLHFNVDRALFQICVFQIAVILTLISSGTFGIFGVESRIEYLSGKWFLKYVTYLNVVMLPFLAKLVSVQIGQSAKSDRLILYNIIVLVFSSILSGSKAGFVFWFLMFIALLDRESMKRCFKSFVPWIVFVPVVGLIAYVVHNLANQLAIPVDDVIQLLISRFLLNNDARALAFSVVPESQGWFEFLTNSFRGYSSKLGIPPADPPLGNLLYSEYFGPSFAINGANASLTALVLFYLGVLQGWVVLATIALFSFLIIIFFRVALKVKYMGDQVRLIFLCFGVSIVKLMWQDFLAFQLVLNILIVFMLVFFVAVLVKRSAIDR